MHLDPYDVYAQESNKLTLLWWVFVYKSYLDVSKKREKFLLMVNNISNLVGAQELA